MRRRLLSTCARAERRGRDPLDGADSSRYATVLRECGIAGDLPRGKHAHEHLLRNGYSGDALLGNIALQMYARCGSVDEAAAVFDSTAWWNVHSWAAMIAANARLGHLPAAVWLFRSMDLDGVPVNRAAVLALVGACSKIGGELGLRWGREAHVRMVAMGLSVDDLAGNMMIAMYGKCGCTGLAMEVFDAMESRDLITWNSIIGAYAQNGQGREALAIFHRMVDPEGSVNRQEQRSSVQVCGYGDSSSPVGDSSVRDRDLSDRGRDCGFQDGNSSAGSYQDRNFAKGESDRPALAIVPNEITYVTVLGACSSSKDLDQGRNVHSSALERFRGNLSPEIANALVHMYCKCGSVEEARSIFDGLVWRHPISCSTLMAIYIQRGNPGEAMKILRQMELDGSRPSNPVIFTRLLEACARSPPNRSRLDEIHSRVVAMGLDKEIMVATALIAALSRSGDLDGAVRAFDRIQSKNAVAWNAAMAALNEHGCFARAVEIYRRMEPEGVRPTDVSYIHALCSCSGMRDLALGRAIHDRAAADGIDTEVFLGNAIVNMYAKCSRLDLALAAFEKIERKDVVSWNSAIAAMAQLGGSEQALAAYRRMVDEERMEPTKITLVHALGAAVSLGSVTDTKMLQEDAARLGLEHDLLVGSALVNALGKGRCLDAAFAVFERMERRNVVSWSGLIAALVEHGRGRDAINLFRRMELDGIKPNEVTLLSAIDACAGAGAVTEGRAAHRRVTGCGYESETNVANALINMYGKCGHLGSARAVFDGMPWRNVVSWTALLAGYAHHGHTDETMRVFKDMSLDGVQPNVVTFVSVLFSCSHAGVVSDGLEQFHIMVGDFEIVPVAEHFGCVIDLLGRAGWLDEAEELLRTMPVEPDKAAWNSLLGACKVHSHTDGAKRIAKLACDLELPFASAPYVLLSNMYTDEEQQGEPEQEEGGVQMTCSSLIEVKGRVHEFVAGEWSHPRIEEIEAELQRLQEEVAIVTGACEEQEDRVSVQKSHSLKLAVAWGVVATPQGSPLHVVHTRRVCKECHSDVKVISKIVGRKIVVRDSNRFHHIEQGVCSCGDYCEAV